MGERLVDAQSRNLTLSGIQRNTTDAAFTILSSTTLVDLAVNVASSRVVTMPPATAGRRLKVLWTVEQAGNDRVFTAAGSDTLVGGITTKVEGNAGGDGDQVAVAAASTAITTVDDVNPGSYLEFDCLSNGVWVVSGELIVDAVGSVPTVA